MKSLKLRRKYEVDESAWLVKFGRSHFSRVVLSLRRVMLFFRWGRVPKTWELAFVEEMKRLERDGVSFKEVLHSTLPVLFGEDTSVVLKSWVGRKSLTTPTNFAKGTAKMFGKSSRSVLGSIQSTVDENALLEVKAPRDPPYKSLLEAIQLADLKLEMQQESPQVSEEGVAL